MENKTTVLLTTELSQKYFDEVITSSGIDPQKRPKVVLQWAQEKEAERREADLIGQEQLGQVLSNKKKAQIQQREIRLNQLKKREQYLATLSKPGRLPKINKKILNSDVSSLDSLVKPFFPIENDMIDVSSPADNYGTIFMRKIGRTLLEQHNMYHQVKETEVSLTSTKKDKKKKWWHYFDRKDSKSR